MKALLFLLLLPLFAATQTVHRKGNKILYEGDVPLDGRPASVVLGSLQHTAGELIKKGKAPAAVQADGQTLVALADMRLNSDNASFRTVNYTLALTAKDGGYSYRIDSVYIIDRNRDGSEKKKTAKDLLQNMQVSGPVAEAAEKLLNEIDMNFQRLLAVMRSKMQKDLGGTH